MMAKHEVLDSSEPGRRSGLRRLVYRFSADAQASAGASNNGAWRDSRDWSAIKDRLRLTVKRAPEVVINVKGSRRAKDGDHAAVEGVLRYMMYISRNGRLLTVNERGEQLNGREAIREAHASWDLDMQRMRSGKNEPLHPSFNIIFSMPAKTDPDRMLDAVQAFARERFQDHQYVMALHTHDTDPADDAPEHPHVHLILRAEDDNGQRIYIRKAHLRAWREEFAAQLRARGIEANATPRSERGRSFKSKRSAEWHIQRRYEEDIRRGRNPEPPRARTGRFHDAAKELQEGRVEQKPWEIAMAARRRNVMREFAQSATRLRQEGDTELAEQVECFMQNMPPLDSERRQIQRALIEQVRHRLQEHDLLKEKDPPR
ncbi:hypothetical protein [Massilia sp. X63]|uniref:relaxase/mobilization nuclease domain-containing protein n=1 Tax=Massilia sp. X63 TaxID=3237285 RepID=UPI0034DD04E4